MTNTIGALDVALTMNTAAFVAGTQKARDQLRSFSAQTNTALAGIDRAYTRAGTSINALIGRYTSLYAVVRTGQRLIQDVAQSNTEAGRELTTAMERLNKEWLQFGETIGPGVAAVMNTVADIARNTNKEIQGIIGFFGRTARAVGIDTANYRSASGVPLLSAMNIPDSVTVTPVKRSGLGDIMAGDTMVNASLRDFTASFDSGVSGQLAADREFKAERYREQQELIRRSYQYQQEALEQTQKQVADTKAALLDMSSALVFGMMRGGNAIGFVIDQLAMTIIQAKLLKPLIDSLNIGGGGGGWFGDLLSGGASFLGGLGIGGGGGYNAASDLYRAAGGPVSAGRPYVVGENGPEVVTFGASGYVHPNGALGGMTVYVDARGSDVSVADLKAAMVGAYQAALNDAVGTVAKRQRGTGRRF